MNPEVRPRSSGLLSRLVFGLACLITATALFYAEERWRGQHAWQECKRELQTKGRSFDWAACIPAPVPDEQNIYKAPLMDGFVKAHLNAGGVSTDSKRTVLAQRVAEAMATIPQHDTGHTPTVALELTVVGPDHSSAEPTLTFGAPDARLNAEKFLLQALGPSLPRSKNQDIMTARNLEELKPLQVAIKSPTPLTVPELEEIFSTNAPSSVGPALQHLRIESTGSNSFRVVVGPEPGVVASEVITATDLLKPELDLLRQALKRPCARLEDDYQQPFAIPVPNFVLVRIVAQTLAESAQAHLLLGESEAAWRALSIVRDLCRLVEASPAGKSMTLVSAMIDSAVTGLYTQIVAQGLQLHAWQEPQLAAIQQQLKDVNLLALLVAALDWERVAGCTTLENSSPAQVAVLISGSLPLTNTWQRLRHPHFYLLPRGWVLQNTKTLALGNDALLDSIDSTNDIISPAALDALVQQASTRRRSPYNFLAFIALPNVAKAAQATARNQTLVNEARLACALERYRLAHHAYPESLNALVPPFLDQLPHDLVNGKPFRYRTTPDDSYLLYSVGWNQTDEGGLRAKALDQGDWVWPLQ
jgi:hypothetical protein